MSVRIDIDIEEIGNMAKCISHYYGLASYFTQLDPKQSEKLKEFWDSKFKEAWMSPEEYAMWRQIDISFFAQTWSNTSCGWEGIGGSAISSSYTLVIENNYLGFFCVYYGDKLVYIAHLDENAKERIAHKSLPGMKSTGKLNIIYKRPAGSKL